MTDVSANNTSLIVDATDGGYILASLDPPPDLDWQPSQSLGERGQVEAGGSTAVVSSMGADETDERVYLSSILRNRAVSQSELQRRADQGQHGVPRGQRHGGVGSQEEPATEEPRGLLRGSETQNPRWIWE